MPKTLYICYFGVREPLVQTQVIPYIRELLKGDYSRPGAEKGTLKASLLTFEPDPEIDVESIRRQLTEEGIDWHWLPYHKRFSAIATAWDIFRGALFVRKFISKELPDILHGRVHVPTLMGALARKFSRHKPKLLFDIRGFFPEEYTDAGVWPENGILYRSAKRVERWLLKESDGFVVLTEKAREILFPESEHTGSDKDGRPVEVIPCCVNLERFEAVNGDTRTKVREKLGVADRRVIAYIGAFGGWYMTNETAELLAAARESDPSTFALILTQSEPEIITKPLRAAGFSDKDYFVRRVPPSELPDYLSAADVSVSFIKPCYSKQASSPTKNAEYLASGLPIIANRGVGDVDSQIERNGVGALIDSFGRSTYLEALETVANLGEIDDRCREIARREFDLNSVGGKRYQRIYRRLLER